MIVMVDCMVGFVIRCLVVLMLFMFGIWMFIVMMLGWRVDVFVMVFVFVEVLLIIVMLGCVLRIVWKLVCSSVWLLMSSMWMWVFIELCLILLVVVFLCVCVGC